MLRGILMTKGSKLYYYRPWGAAQKNEWIDVDGELLLTNKVQVPTPGLTEADDEYVPVPSTALFRDFAGVEPTPEHIKRFVTRHGFLGNPAGYMGYAGSL